MRLGIRLRKLWRLRVGVLVCLLFATFVAVWSAEKISFFPPKLEPRAIQMGSATTHVILDRPRSTIIDLRSETGDFEQLTTRALLLGNVIANGVVRDSIAHAAGTTPDRLLIAAPLTPKQPQAVVDSKAQKHASDILKSNDEYRLTIFANPTVPVLDIYAEAPDARKAEQLANGAVDGLQRYLGSLAARESTPPEAQIRLVQLGRAHGTVVNPSANTQVMFVAFLLTFGLSCATLIYIDRVRKGWSLAKQAEQPATA
jgi:hypothetical protein